MNLEERNLLSPPIVQLVQSTLTMGNHHGNWNTHKSSLYELKLHSFLTIELLIRIILTKFHTGRPSLQIKPNNVLFKGIVGVSVRSRAVVVYALNTVTVN